MQKSREVFTHLIIGASASGLFGMICFTSDGTVGWNKRTFSDIVSYVTDERWNALSLFCLTRFFHKVYPAKLTISKKDKSIKSILVFIFNPWTRVV